MRGSLPMFFRKGGIMTRVKTYMQETRVFAILAGLVGFALEMRAYAVWHQRQQSTSDVFDQVLLRLTVMHRGIQCCSTVANSLITMFLFVRRGSYVERGSEPEDHHVANILLYAMHCANQYLDAEGHSRREGRVHGIPDENPGDISVDTATVPILVGKMQRCASSLQVAEWRNAEAKAGFFHIANVVFGTRVDLSDLEIPFEARRIVTDLDRLEI